MISIIMPVYNRAYIVGDAIKSVINQTYKNWELIVVDDGSKDNTKEVVSSFSDERIRFFSLGSNKGANYARNFGLKNSQGEYVAFLDSDNIWKKTFLKSRLGHIEKYNVDLLFGRINQEDSGNIWPENDAKEMKDKEDIIRIMSFGNLIDTNTVLMKKKCLQYVKGFDNDLRRFQDWDFFFALLCQDVSVKFVNNVLVTTRVQEDSISKKEDLFWESRLKILRKYIQEYRQRGYLFDVLYYLINSLPASEEERDRVEKDVLNCVNIEDFIGVFPRLKSMDIAIADLLRDFTEAQKNTIELQKTIKKKRWHLNESQFEYRTRIVIYGYGDVGKDIVEQIGETKRLELVGIIDKNEIHNEKQIDIDTLKKIDYDYVLITVINEQVANEMRDFLLANRVKASKCLLFRDMIKDE